MVSVPHAGSGTLSVAEPDVGGVGRVKLIAGASGRRATVTYAQIARANPWAVSAIGGRAGLASRVPIHVFLPDEEGRDGHRERVRAGSGGTGSRLASQMVSPEPRMSGRKWRRKLFGDGLTHGNTLIEKVRSGGAVTGLRWQPWADVEPVLSSDGLTVEVFKVPIERRDGITGRIARGETRPIDRDDAIHLTFGEDTAGPMGVSPLASLHNTHALHEAALRFAANYMNNGIFPTGSFEPSAHATADQLEATRQLIESLHAGPANAGKPFLAYGKWHQISATPEGAKLVELAKLSREEIGAAYRTPMSQLGDTRDTNKATAGADRTRFIRDVVGEDVAVLESEMMAQHVLPNRRWVAAGLWVEAELFEILRPDVEKLAEVVYREVQGPVATPNDGRRMIGLPPLDDPAADQLVLNPGTPEQRQSSSAP